MDLNDPVLIEVFADYTNPELPETWKRVQGIAAEFGNHRVVLRSTAETTSARHAVQLAECARIPNRFSRVQGALIEHPGPWELDPLLDLASEKGLDRNATRSCFDEIDVTNQIDKDRQHARERSIPSFPAVSIDREMVSDTVPAIRLAIRRAMVEKSL